MEQTDEEIMAQLLAEQDEDIDDDAIEAELNERLLAGDLYSDFDDAASAFSKITVQTTKTNRNEVAAMSQTSRSFMGGAEFINPDIDLDDYMNDLLKNKNKGFRRKMEAQQKAFVA